MEYVIKLTGPDLNVIGDALTRAPLPYVVVAPMLAKIDDQVREQIPQRENDPPADQKPEVGS